MANGVALLLMVALSSRYGFRVHRGTLVGLLLPISIPLGPWVVLLLLGARRCGNHRFRPLPDARGKAEIWSGLGQYLGKLRPRRAEAAS